MIKLSLDSVTFSSSSRVALVLWLSYCFVGYAVPKRDAETGVEEKSNNKNYLLFAACSLSVVAWIIGLGVSSNHPTDNDALSNAFLLRRFAETPDRALCMVPGDVSRLINMRFESCGSYILAHYSNLFGWAPWDKVLNNNYLLTAFFLPLGAAASWQYFSDVRKHRWIAAATSTTFLVYPYALNGLSRLTLGLAFVLPLIGLCSSIEKRDSHQLVLISLSLIGLGYIHMLALTIVLIYLALVLIFKFLIIPLHKSSKTSSLLRATNLCMRATIVLPTYFFFGSDPAIRSSVSNVLVATGVINHSKPDNALTGVSANTSLVHLWGEVKNLKFIFLGNDWAHAQPLLFTLFLFGIFLLLRQKLAFVPLVLSGAASYCFFLSITIWDTHLSIYHFLFLNNWYRLFSVMVIFLIIPVAVSISYIVSHFSKKSKRVLLLVPLLFAYLVSLATGASIVNTAWNHASKPTAQIMDQFDGLKLFANNRTLNDPKDGSSWAYSRSGLQLLSPNDRTADMELAKNINLLVNEKSRLSVCPFLIDQKVTAVLGVSESLRKLEILLQDGVVDRIAFESQDVKLGLLSQTFLSTCQASIQGKQ